MPGENERQKCIRESIKKFWEKLTYSEIKNSSQDFLKLAPLIEDRYGETKLEVELKMRNLLDSFDNKTDLGILVSVPSFQRSPLTDSTSFK